MALSVRVHLLPRLVPPEELAGGVVVVIDVLRASTTMIYALAAGATEVLPCGEIDEARATIARRPEGTCVSGGERHGVRISGFDLGNTPTDYNAQSVGGKVVVFTTTNGTRALMHARQSARIVVGAFANLSAIVSMLAADSRPAHLLCAGTDGHVTLEDALFAGAVLHELRQADTRCEITEDGALLAWDAWGAVANQPERLVSQMRNSRGGANLVELGLGTDIETCARIDVCRVVPELAANGALVDRRAS